MKHKCQFCSKAYWTSDKLIEHELVNHIKKDVRDVICKICSRAFVTQLQLQGHMKNLHVKGLIPCDFAGCDKKFHRLSKKDRHMRVHTKENKYKCDQCSRDFSYSWILSKHKRKAHAVDVTSEIN